MGCKWEVLETGVWKKDEGKHGSRYWGRFGGAVGCKDGIG